MEDNRKYYNYLDVAKGIAIIAVVLGHCFPTNIYNGDGFSEQVANSIYDFIYLWHMPTFFFISGFLWQHNWLEKNYKKLKDKAFRLLVPYLSFSFLYIPLRLFFSSMANSTYTGFWKILIGVSPNGGVWYLYLLFLFFCFSSIFIRSENILVVSIIIGLITNTIINCNLITIDYSVLRYFFKFYVFFALGILFKSRYEILWFKRVIVLMIAAFIIIYIISRYFDFYYFDWLLSFLGIAIVLSISSSFKNRFLQKIGLRSMDIYLLHGPLLILLRLLPFGSMPKLLFSLLIGVMALALSYYIGLILHKSKFLSIILFGEKKGRLSFEENIDI